jgi:DNA repair exonuclease SbcCD nuclease subunit
MKIALFSDLHAHNWQEFATYTNGIPDRLMDCVSVLSELRHYCEEAGIRHVVFGGDLFHKRGVLYTAVYNLVVEELVKFRESEIALFCVDGNHDHADKAGSTHAVQALSSVGLVQEVPHWGWLNYTIEGLVISGFSYCDDREEFRRRLESAEEEYGRLTPGAARILVFHHGFTGARVGSHLEYTVKEAIEGWRVNIDCQFDRVFSGHYHTRQGIQGIKGGMYIGSPLQHTRSDRTEQDKGFLVYDTESRAVALVPLRRPRFLLYTDADLEHAPVSAWDVEGDFVDVALSEPAAVRLGALVKGEIETQLWKGGARGSKVTVEARKTLKAPRLSIDASLSPTALLERYVQHKERDDPELLRLGRELLEKAEGP